jgi:UDP-N-acetylglucosamine 2-epimerase (non-hydrolysing)
MQEETIVLGAPCITLRSETDRKITTTHGTNRVLGEDKRAIPEAVNPDCLRKALGAGATPVVGWPCCGAIVKILEDRFG